MNMDAYNRNKGCMTPTMVENGAEHRPKTPRVRSTQATKYIERNNTSSLFKDTDSQQPKNGLRKNPECAENRNKGSINTTMVSDVPDAGQKTPRVRSSQAERYAERNKGSLHTWMNDYDNGAVPERPVSARGQSAEAAAIASKYKSTLGSILQMGSSRR